MGCLLSRQPAAGNITAVSGADLDADLNDDGEMAGRTAGRVALAKAWLAATPDEHERAELTQRLAGRSTSADESWLAEHFGTPLTFGTAGLRGQIGIGPARMNRLMVRVTARAIAQVLQDSGLDEAGVVVGFDARHGSADYAADSARLLVALGIPTALIDAVVPTPVLARQLLARQAGAAIMVTASHNPRADNGYKVYWNDGTQIRPPIDAQIEAKIQAQLQSADLVVESDLAPLHEVEMIETQAAIADYVGAAIVPFGAGASDGAGSRDDAGSKDGAGGTAQDHIQAVYTALSGVGTKTLEWAFAVAGLAPPVLVEHQCRPDPDFEGLPFPNPEEPGTLDAAMALADERGIDLVIANDPDADRFAVAVRTADGAWCRLTGDELGVLLCDHMIRQTDSAGPHQADPQQTDPQTPRLAASSVVSGAMVEALCAAGGVQHHRTLTGFKWVMLPRLTNPDATWVFGYEEALGYSVSDAVLDKDGISAAVEFMRLAQSLAARGAGPLDRLDELALELGVFETRQVSIRASASAIAAVMSGLRSQLRTSSPVVLEGSAGATLSSVTDWKLFDPPRQTDLLEMRFDDSADSADSSAGASTAGTAAGPGSQPLNRRICVRPSGTEPKAKIYLEVSAPAPTEAATADVAAGSNKLAELRSLCNSELDAMSKTASSWFD